MLHDSFIGARAFNSLSQLTSLHLVNEDLRSEEPWGSIAKLTSLQELYLSVSATGDPSPLSALTGLSHLSLHSLGRLAADGPAPFSFGSLQPLSTLQQLEVLNLGLHACAATSLQGLAGLSNLKELGIELGRARGMLRSLDGISPGVTKLMISYAPDLVNLAGIEGCESMEMLSLHYCGVSSLQSLRGLSCMKDLRMVGCCVSSLGSLHSMSMQSLTFFNCSSLTELSGVEHLSSLQSLVVEGCGVTSLQPLSQLRECLQELKVYGCKQVQEEVLDLPYVQPTADVVVQGSNVRKVVVAGGGGVRRVVQPA
jgi:Leucine-rich repeat (LRR) protein